MENADGFGKQRDLTELFRVNRPRLGMIEDAPFIYQVDAIVPPLDVFAVFQTPAVVNIHFRAR